MASSALRSLKSVKTLTFVGNAKCCLKQSSGRKFAGDSVLPFEATDFKDLHDNHPYLKLWGDVIQRLRDGLALPAVAEALKGVEIRFQLYRRYRHTEMCRCQECR